jgi:hypothetical protein
MKQNIWKECLKIEPQSYSVSTKGRCKGSPCDITVWLLSFFSLMKEHVNIFFVMLWQNCNYAFFFQFPGQR